MYHPKLFRHLSLLCFAVLLVYGIPAHSETSIEAIEARSIEQKNIADAKAENERKAEADRIAGLQRKCEKNGGDWKRGRCVMPQPPKPKPHLPLNPVVVVEPPAAPVRQAPPATAVHYRINGDGTMTDTQRGLMWKQCSEGQSGSGCSGTAAKYTWDDAMSRFGSGVSFAGYSDWRMPTKDELKSLVYCSNGTPTPLPDYRWCSEDRKGFQSPTINQQAFPNMPEYYNWYWSSTAENASAAWVVDFDSGSGLRDGRVDHLHVRLVRSGQ